MNFKSHWNPNVFKRYFQNVQSSVKHEMKKNYREIVAEGISKHEITKCLAGEKNI